MSVVTNIILSVSVLDKNLVVDVDNWIRFNHYYYNQLMDIDLCWQGNKGFEGCVVMGAYNYFDLYEFKDHIFKFIPWKEPQDVQLLSKTEEQQKFDITSFKDVTIEISTTPLPTCPYCIRPLNLNKTQQHCQCGKYYLIHWYNSDSYSILTPEII